MPSLPPARLMRRVGWYAGSTPAAAFDERGTLQWQLVRSLVPPGHPALEGRILDFGCGVGRMLRAAVADDLQAEIWGCDVHGPSVDWLQRDLGDRARVVKSGESPPLPFPDAHFDLIYAFSVLTHLVDSWSEWLLELRRILRPGGLLIATVVGPGRDSSLFDEPVGEDLIGMNVLAPSKPWSDGGPLVVHSEWWLRAHWGRAFDVVSVHPGDQAGSPPQFGQGVIVLQPNGEAVTPQDLERPEPGEPREMQALRQNVSSLRREVARHSALRDTRSWRLTAPMRALARRLRR